MTQPKTDTNLFLQELARDCESLFQKRQVVLSYGGFLERLKQFPEHMVRNAAQYIRDTFDHFGTGKLSAYNLEDEDVRRFKLFDIGTEKGGPIIGGEGVHDEIYKVLQSFVRQGHCSKLILLHGPNGSSKSSTVEALARAMQQYSETEEGAVYRFSWVFPTEKTGDLRSKGESGPIGFASKAQDKEGDRNFSYAFLDEAHIASKIHSEFKDNPIYLIPMPQRETLLRELISSKTGKKPEDVEIPAHVRLAGLSKRNQLIFENLLAAYEGNLVKVLRHIQVERFYYSRQYRVGIASVEPQMSIDANEKQLTMDKNIANLPAILHNISFHEAQGELIEANRGFLEFSDLLKRPVEAFKYLLTTVEKSVLSLPSSTANLDIVFMATTNEKHLDAFKTIPDFSSFRGRFELVTVPYLLKATDEERIYEADVKAIQKNRNITRHSIRLLCVWAVMTRLKQPDPEFYEGNYRGLVARLDPRSKLRLYEGETMQPVFRPDEEVILKDLRTKVFGESQGMVVYEGRFGASPREVRALLYRAGQSARHATLTPMAIFDELERLIKDRSVYEFLQFEPRGKYHDAALFLRLVQDEFADLYEHELLSSMALVDEGQYQTLLQRYIDHVVARIKKEKIYNSKTGSHEEPSQAVMTELESIIGVQGDVERYREGVLGRIAAYKIDNPKSAIDVTIIFQDILRRLQEHYYADKNKIVQANYRAMLAIGTDDERSINDKEKQLAATTYSELERRFGYDQTSARDCLRFLLSNKQKRGTKI